MAKTQIDLFPSKKEAQEWARRKSKAIKNRFKQYKYTISTKADKNGWWFLYEEKLTK